MIENDLIDIMEFSIRTSNSLKRAGIETYQALFAKIDEGIPALLSLRYINRRCAAELLQKAQKLGYPAVETVNRYLNELREAPIQEPDRILAWEAVRDSLRLIDTSSPK